MEQNMKELDMDQAVKQFKEYFIVYNKITEKCFGDCITNFTTRKIMPDEDSCAMKCLQKYLKMTQRISEHYQEHTAKIQKETNSAQT